jgi:glycosyltransferase involved in cell wall biosynthesis
MNSNNISFFIPAYNCADTIIESINSIIDTNFRDGDEIVITDDGSTDNTGNILNDLACKYQFIRLIKHQRNRGGAAARNTAIENAKHDILFCLDSDNVLAPDSIGPLKNFLLDNHADCASFQSLHFFRETTDRVDEIMEFAEGLITIEHCLSHAPVPPNSGNYMFTKQSWKKAGGYPEENWLDTWGFGIRQLFTGSKMLTLPGTFYYHRRGHESYWIRENRKGKISLTALQILIPYLDLLSESSEDYIMSKKGRYTWFRNLDKRPLTLAKNKRQQNDPSLSILKNNIKVKFPIVTAIYSKIKKIF